MKLQKYKNIILFSISFFAIGFLVYIANITVKQVKHKVKIQDFVHKVDFRNGDLIFRKGKSIVSHAVLVSDKQSDFSHVGIIFIKGHEPYVIHAVPGESKSGVDYLKCEQLKDFLSFKKASKGAIYRIKDSFSIYCNIASNSAYNYFESKRIFDDKYDYNSEDKMYCTELVWKAYKKCGIDLINHKIDILNLPFSKMEIILPGSLTKSEYVDIVSNF